jgi:hypothetical protein
MGNMESANELLGVIDDLREANDALLHATTAGDAARVEDLMQTVANLEHKRNRLVHAASPATPRLSSQYESIIPLRDQVIRALELTGSPSSARLIADVTKSRWAERVDTTKLSSLRRDEARSWRKTMDLPGRTTRDIYIVPALTFDRFTPVRATVALSTWPMSRRLIAPLSPRVDMLNSTIRLAEEAGRVVGTSYDESVKRLVARLGASIPGVSVFGADPSAVIEAAQAELEQIEPTDAVERQAGAERAEDQLTLEARLFGTHLRAVSARDAARAR